MEPCESERHTCAGIPHQQLQLFLYRCPHDGSVVLWTTKGTTDAPQLAPYVVFGPFDSHLEVEGAVMLRMVEWLIRSGQLDAGPLP